MLMSLVLFLLLLLSLQLAAASIAKPNCPEKCGNVSIPYPFGIGNKCYYSKSYEIICSRTHKPFLKKFNLEVMNITLGQDSQQSQVLLVRTDVHNTNTCRSNSSIDFGGSPFSFSGENALVMKGCSGSVLLRNRSGNILAGCAAICGIHNTVDLYGVGACQAELHYSSFEFYEMDLDVGADSYTCGNMRMGLMDMRRGSGFSVNELSKTSVPTILIWQGPASYIQNNSAVDHPNFKCQEEGVCYCSFPYEGSPYLLEGCQFVEKCSKCRYGCDISGIRFVPYHYYCKKNPWFKWQSILGNNFIKICSVV